MADVSDVRNAHRFDEAALRQYLIAALRLPATATLQVKQFTNGQSNPTFLLAVNGQRMVLRKKPPGKLLPKAHMVCGLPAGRPRQ
jgi:aminoglycoside phosphotransferase (APT) family kinase protein